MVKNKKSLFKAVEIEINKACNMSPPCSYCPNSKKNGVGNDEMDEKTFTRILSQLQEMGFDGRVSFHLYGEPLLSKNMDSYVRLTRQMLLGCRIVIYTNGLLLSKDRLIELIKEGVDQFIVTRHEGVDSFSFDTFILDLEEDYKKCVDIIKHSNLLLTTRGGTMGELKRENEVFPLKKRCFIPSSLVVITCEGNVLPCYEDYKQENIMGNIHNDHLETIWNRDRYVEFRSNLKEGNRGLFPACDRCNNILVVR